MLYLPVFDIGALSTLVRHLVALSTKWKPYKILSNISGQITKELGTNGPWDTLYQYCSNYLTFLQILPLGGVASFSISVLVKLFLSEIAWRSKKDNSFCLKSLALEP